MNKKNKYTLLNLVSIVFLLLAYPLHSYAFSVGITVRGKVLSPACTINGGREILVNFGGGIFPRNINGINHEVNIPYTISCPSGASNLLKLKVAGTNSSFNATLLTTNKNNLAIELKSNNTKLAINKWIDFLYSTPPILSAVLVRNSTGPISLGSFNASASIVVEYR